MLFNLKIEKFIKVYLKMLKELKDK